MRKRPKFTPDMALDRMLYEAIDIIRAIQYDTDDCCQMCGARRLRCHAERCSIRDVLWNLENRLREIND